MKVIKSVCTNLFFPQSRSDAQAFAGMIGFLKEYGVQSVECYCDGHQRAGELIGRGGMSGVYIGVIPLKEQKKDLCALEEEARSAAVMQAKRDMDRADQGGFDWFMVNSGRRTPGREAQGMAALLRSMEELFEYRYKKGMTLGIEMEPCDSALEAMHLVGGPERALEVCRALEQRGLPLSLVMDSAHTSEEGRDFFQALTLTRPYCRHIHFANCRLDDPQDPLYGDKHLGYEDPGGIWTFEAIRDMMKRLEALYGDQPLRVGLECLCRQENPFAWFQSTWERLPKSLTGAERKTDGGENG